MHATGYDDAMSKPTTRSDADFTIIFVPGIQPKPPVPLHTAQLCRCLQAGLLRAGCPEERAARLVATFGLVGWSRQFYGMDGDVGPLLVVLDLLVQVVLAPASPPVEVRGEQGTHHPFAW